MKIPVQTSIYIQEKKSLSFYKRISLLQYSNLFPDKDFDFKMNCIPNCVCVHPEGCQCCSSFVNRIPLSTYHPFLIAKPWTMRIPGPNVLKANIDTKALCCGSVDSGTNTGRNCAYLETGRTCAGHILACSSGCEVVTTDGSGVCC